MRDLNTLDECCERDTSDRVKALYGSVGDDKNGCFWIRIYGRRGPNRFFAVASATDGWEHLSVSLANRTPTWQEMAMVASLFFHPEERLVMYRPPRSEYVNIHDHCLHWWKPVGVELPFPPREFV